MSRALQKFQDKYPFSREEWHVVDEAHSCQRCSAEIYNGEVALYLANAGYGYLCTSCAVDYYNECQRHQNDYDEPEERKSIENTSSSRMKQDWMILASNYCYFCGVLHSPCEHMKRLQ